MTNGLVVMTPSSIAYSGTSASINADGSVDFSAVTELRLNGVFTSDYDNYMVTWRGTTSTGTNIYARFGSGGGTPSATGYVDQRINADNTSVAAVRGSVSTYAWLHSDYATQKSGFTTYFFGPYLAQPTAWRTVAVPDYQSAYIRDLAGTHSASTSYTDLYLERMSSGTMTGLVTVFGFNQ